MQRSRCTAYVGAFEGRASLDGDTESAWGDSPNELIHAGLILPLPSTLCSNRLHAGLDRLLN